ncbi:MAG: hypothetical protein L0Y35_03450 [Flammeovirgaceae bacterium]|nr:hypothetical protein [Flammeovirgaceae bacterium]
MKKFLLSLVVGLSLFPSKAQQLILPDSAGWNMLLEGKELSFQLKSDRQEEVRFSLEASNDLGISFDSIGNFKWTPSYELADRVSKTKDITIIFQANWRDGKRIRKPVTFVIMHVNRAPIVEEMPVFYVKQSSQNNYQISSDYVFDPDGDPLVFKPSVSQMPEGAKLSSQGLFTWALSRSQFNALRSNPLSLEFVVQDQPDKGETIGKIKIAQTQLDLPPELLIVPSDSVFTLKEDETLNLKIYISDPNGDDNVRNAGFVSSDTRIQNSILKENTHLQYELTWMPGYEFVQEVQKQIDVDLTLFALDKSNNRAQRKIKIKIQETENVAEKDNLQYQKYKNNLVSAVELLQLLDENQKKLNEDYKKAKRGKKHRSIVNASLGATTGFSPIFLENDPNASKIVSGVGGTTVLTLNTLEATEVIGKSKDDIMDKIKINVDIRNRTQAAGDEFARKFALKSARRTQDFEKEIEKLRLVINDQRIVLLELDAYKKNQVPVESREIKRTFPDYSEE